MTEPLLSICIPTFNRAGYLRDTLAALAAQRFSFPIEVIVGDNASPDETPSVIAAAAKTLPLTSFRHPENRGHEANLISVFMCARAPFALYLADDDRLIPSTIEKYVAMLKADPTLMAVYAAWDHWDQAAGQSHGLAYNIPQAVSFGPDQGLEVFDLVARHHVFPEIGIFRTAMLGGRIFPHRHIHWAFALLARLMDVGHVHFAADPYYQFIVNFGPDDSRDNLGRIHSRTLWDTHRGGLEALLAATIRRRGTPLTPAQDAGARLLIDMFMAARLAIAARMAAERGDFMVAAELVARRGVLLAMGAPDAATAPNGIEIVAAYGALAELYRLTNTDLPLTIVDRTTNQVAGMAESLKGLGLKITIRAEPAATADTRSLLLVASEESRNTLLARRAPAGHIIDESALITAWGSIIRPTG